MKSETLKKNTVNILPVFMVEKPPNKKNIKKNYVKRLFISLCGNRCLKQ